MSGQFKQLANEQNELLKKFSRKLAEQDGFFAENKSMTGIQAYKYFYETFGRPEENRSNQRKLLKPKYQDPFASDTKRMIDEKKKILDRLLNEVPDLRTNVNGRYHVSDYRADTLRYYEIWQKICASTEDLKN